MRLAELEYSSNPIKKRTIDFRGLNKKAVIDDGEMRDMKNLSSDEYPCLFQRKPRGLFDDSFENPRRMIVKNKKLAVISNNQFFYDGTQYPNVKISDKTEMVAINSKICFFPEKIYFDVKSLESGNLFASYDSLTKYTTIKITDSKVTLPDDTFDLTTVFSVGDVVDLKFIETDSSIAGKYDVMTVIEEIGKRYVKFPGDTFASLAAEGKEEVTIAGKVNIKRSCPDLDYVMESNNRLWGVSNKDNTIYACKLGDPKNWFYYQATSLDSYAVEVGTDGEWTGCVPYTSHLLFFKEDCIHKLYGSTPATYQLSTAECYALEKGSSKSVAVVNERVLYKSRLGIMAYAGGTPELISANFGSDKYINAVAGTDGIKYYVSAERNGKYDMLVFDMEKLLWHKEDNLKVLDFTFLNGSLLYIGEDKKIYEINTNKPMEEGENIEWYAEFGAFDEFIEENKIYSKLKFRVRLEQDSELEIMLKVDNGEWERMHHYYATQKKSVTIPIVPRRCFSFTVRLQGKGRCKVESFVREYREGVN